MEASTSSAFKRTLATNKGIQSAWDMFKLQRYQT